MADERTNKRTERARTALAAGDVEHAVDEAWWAAATAARRDDEPGLLAVRALAVELRDRADGDVRTQAEQLAAYCSHCLVSVRAGGRRSLLERLFSPRRGRDTKTCPDCAEAVQAAAHVCRFCGYRFDT